MANRLTVTIGGQVFHLVADEELEYMQKIARAADEKVREAVRLTGSSTFAAGVLATLNIADDAVKSRDALGKAKLKISLLEKQVKQLEAAPAPQPEAPAETAALRERLALLESGVLKTQEQLEAALAENEGLKAEATALRREANTLRQQAAQQGAKKKKK